MVSDNHFFVPAYFTSAASIEFTTKFSAVDVLELKTKSLRITKWSLELKKVNSMQVFTSDNNLECRLIVNSFNLLISNPSPPKYVNNLYRDMQFKSTIAQFRHKQVIAAAS